MKKRVIMFSIIIVFINLPVYGAHFYKGNDLVEIMRVYEKVAKSASNLTNEDYLEATKFIGYVTGISDTLEATGATCRGIDASRGQVCSVVAKYLNDNPEKWSMPGYRLVMDALVRAFPCKK